MIRRPPISTQSRSSAESDVYKRLDMLGRLISREKPDALLPTMGGQTGLNAGIQLAEAGILEKYNVEFIGAKAEAIAKAEDLSLIHISEPTRPY